MTAGARARAPGASRRAILLAVLASIASSSAGCVGASPDAVASDLCRDLEHLEETITLLLEPASGATVGEVRGALEKVSPVLERIASAPQTSAALGARLEDVEERLREALDGFGDDDLASSAAAGLAAPRTDLDRDLASAVAALGCQPAA